MPETITRSPVRTTQADPQYLPIRQFVEKMAQHKEANPYSATFSFGPFIEKMKHYKEGLQQAVPAIDADFADEVAQRLLTFADPSRLDTPEKRQEVIAMFFPSLFFEGQIGFVAKPFSKEFFYTTPALQEMFSSEDWEVKVSGYLMEGKMGSPALEAGKLILNTFHGQNMDFNSYQQLTFRHRKTLLERHYRIRVVLDYIKTTPLKPVRKLEHAETYELFNEWNNEAYWLQQFPPSDYAFEGLVVGYIQDISEAEILSQLKEIMVSDADQQLDGGAQLRQQLNRLICSYLRMPEVVFGNILNRDFKYATLFSWSVIGDLTSSCPLDQEVLANSATYGEVLRTEEPVIVPDLEKFDQPGPTEKHLVSRYYRSLLLVPQRDKNGQVVGIMELASPQPYRFTKQVLVKLQEVLSLFSVGANRWIQLMDNNINFFIQKQFTYIHPSVEWKFQEVSQKYLFAPREEGQAPVLDPIAFKNVYPLYGQADIVGSSKIRNHSIQADMLDNLQRVQQVMKAFRKRLDFQLLDIYFTQTQAAIQRIENGGFVSSDESHIVELLTDEIHPLLRELSEKYDKLPKGILKKYFAYLDPKLDIVYRQRKDYEDSVHALNALIADYVDQEVAKKQEVLPHFFEKYITDGVEYNIYLGQSLLPEGKFSYYFLKDFRLWQLLLMCEVTRLVNKHSADLAVPLTTAQLIFVYNSTLSIHFNMDEKQFDVDGAYNVRYEILKKRIDKAVIKGTNERLTQRGKIAIVWLQDKDRAEYLEYLEHLRKQGLITDEIEELELERLQGADGLKALRVTVAG